MSKGFIQLDREIFESSIFKNKEPFSKREAWIDILVMVNYKDSKIVVGSAIIECKSGQSILSQESWAKRWNWDRSQVRRYLDLLQKAGMISIENIQKTTRITVLSCTDNAQELHKNCTDFAQKTTDLIISNSVNYTQERPNVDPMLTQERPNVDPITDHNIISNKERKEESNNLKNKEDGEFSKNENSSHSQKEIIVLENINQPKKEKKENAPQAGGGEKKKVWGEWKDGEGDGELHELLKEYYLNPTSPKYPPEEYKKFKAYWTALVLSGKDKGKELWRTQKTFSISGRLSTWNQKTYGKSENKTNYGKSIPLAPTGIEPTNGRRFGKL